MSRINTNIPSLMAQHRLSKNSSDLSTRLQRLSSGLKINTGKDAPAALIASETLRSEMAGINQAIENSGRANNVLSTAEGSLQEVSALLLEVQGLTTQAANSGALSGEEIAANQLQVDSILSSVNRIANTTQFNSVKLLNGSLDYTTAGVNTTNFASVRVNSALLADNAPMNVVVAVTQSARTGTIGYTGGTLGAGNAVTVQVAGNKGSQQVSFAGGTSVAQMVTAINAVKNATGVSAISSGTDLGLYSVDFGSTKYVSLQTISGTFVPTGSIGYGRNANVTVNGAAPVGTQTASTVVSNTMKRTNIYAGLSINFFIGKLVGEVGQVSGGTLPSAMNTFGEDAAKGRQYFSVGLRTGF